MEFSDLLWRFAKAAIRKTELQNIRPQTYEGYTINYEDPYYEPCPYHGCITYQTIEDKTLCYCPQCRKLLVHYL